MFKNASIALGVLLFLGLSSATVGTVQAATMDRTPTCCRWTYDHNYNDKGNTYVIESLTERINAMELAIIEALRLGTGQVSGNLKEQIGADSNLANAQDDRAVVGRLEETRMKALLEAASGSSACNTISGASNATSMEAGTLSYIESMMKGMTDWGSGADNMPSSQGTAVAIASRVALHCDRYANAQDVKSGLCENVGTLPNADVDIAQSVFFHNPGAVTGTLSQDREDAANAFILNAINPAPLGAPLQADASTPAGREAAAKRNTDLSRISVANYAAADVVGRRSIQTTGNYADYMRESAKAIPGYDASFDDGVSWYDMMDLRARGWYMNPDWAISVNSRGMAEAVKDGTLINSFQAYLGWETYKLLQRQNMILATMLAIDTENARN